jgi:hypothetical protein
MMASEDDVDERLMLALQFSREIPIATVQTKPNINVNINPSSSRDSLVGPPSYTRSQSAQSTQNQSSRVSINSPNATSPAAAGRPSLTQANPINNPRGSNLIIPPPVNESNHRGSVTNPTSPANRSSAQHRGSAIYPNQSVPVSPTNNANSMLEAQRRALEAMKISSSQAARSPQNAPIPSNPLTSQRQKAPLIDDEAGLATALSLSLAEAEQKAAQANATKEYEELIQVMAVAKAEEARDKKRREEAESDALAAILAESHAAEEQRIAKLKAIEAKEHAMLKESIETAEQEAQRKSRIGVQVHGHIPAQLIHDQLIARAKQITKKEADERAQKDMHAASPKSGN